MSKYTLILLVLLLFFSPLAYTEDYKDLDLNLESTSHLHDGHREDRYQVTISQPGSLAIAIEGEEGLMLDARFYDTNGNTLTSDEQDRTSSRQLILPNLNPGTYTFRVRRNTGEGNYTISPTYVVHGKADDIAPENTQSNAHPLDLEEGATGLLGYHTRGVTDSVVWFQVTINKSGSLTLDIQGEEELMLDARLYDTNGNTLTSDEQDRTSSRQLLYPNLNPGTYTFRIRRNAGHGRYILSPTYVAHGEENDPAPGNTQDEPHTLSLHEPVSGLLGYHTGGTTDSEVWYQVTINKPGSLTLDIQGEEELMLDARLYDTNGNTLISDEQDRTSYRQLLYSNLNPGTYTFRIRRNAGHGRYILSPTYVAHGEENDPAPGNTQDKPHTLTLHEPVSGLLGYHTGGTTDSEVWYQVTINKPGSLTLDIQGEEELMFDARLYDTNGNTLTSDEQDRTSSRQLLYPNLNPGTYTFRIRRNAGHGRYILSPTFISHPAYPGHPPTESADNAPELLLNRHYFGLLGFQGGGSHPSQSWYRMNLSSESPLLIQVTSDDHLMTGLRLYSNGSTVTSDESGRTSGRLIALESLSAATYNLRITRQSNYGEYHIQATDKQSGCIVNPASYDFGQILPGSNKAMNFSLINLGEDPVRVNRAQISGSHAHSFTITEDELSGHELAGRSYKQVLVVFAPEESGAKEATLIFETEEGQHQVELSGNGYEERGIEKTIQQIVLTPAKPKAEREGALIAPGSGKQSKNIYHIDTRAFHPGSMLTIQVTMGSGESSGSFDLFPEDHVFSDTGRPTGNVAYAYDIRPEGGATLTHEIVEPQIFQFNATGNWGSPQGSINTFYLTVHVDDRMEDKDVPKWDETLAIFEELAKTVEAVERESISLDQFLTKIKEAISSLEIALNDQDRGAAQEILQSMAMIDPDSITYPSLCNDLPQIKEKAEQMLASLPAEKEPTIWTDKEHLENEAITIYFANLPGNQQDWITIVSKETPDTEYGQYFYTGGQVEGSFSFRGVVAGEYETRLYLNWPDGGYDVESRFSFTVVERTAYREHEDDGLTQVQEEIDHEREETHEEEVEIELASEPLLMPPTHTLTLEEHMEDVSQRFSKDLKAQLLVVESLVVLGAHGVDELILYLEKENLEIVKGAIKALKEIGPKASKAQLPLANLLVSTKNYDIKQEIIGALFKIGTQSTDLISALEALITTEEHLATPLWVDTVALLAKNNCQPSPQRADLFIQQLDISPEEPGAREFFHFLSHGGPTMAKSLLLPLKEGAEREQQNAAMILGLMGPEASSILPSLLEISQHESPPVRQEVLLSLSLIGPKEEEVAHALKRALEGSKESILAASKSLCELEYQSPEVLAAMIAALRRDPENKELRENLALAAASYGEDALPHLEPMLHRKGDVKKAALLTIMHLGEKAQPLAEMLLQDYLEASMEKQAYILEALASMNIEEANDLLVEAIEREDGLHIVAIEASKHLSQPKEELLALLRETLDHPDPSIQEAALESLVELGEPAINVVLTLLEESDGDKRSLGAMILSRMGLAGAPAMKSLYDLSIHDPDEGVRAEMAQALEDMWSLKDLDVPTQQMPSSLDLLALAETDWTLAVLTTLELVRLIMGPMDEEELKALETEWWSFFPYPTFEMQAYLNELNIHLNEFLMARGALVETGNNYEVVLTDAWHALSYNDVSAYQRSLFLAENLKEIMLGLQKQMAEAGKKALAMLPPPDPEELQQRARQRHEDALLAVSGLDMDEIAARSYVDGLYWVLIRKEEEVNPGHRDPHIRGAIVGGFSGRDLLSQIYREKYPYNYVSSGPLIAQEGMQAGTEMATGGKMHDKKRTVSGYVSWAPPPYIIPHSVIEQEERFFSVLDYPVQVKMGFEVEGYKEGESTISPKVGLHVNVSAKARPEWDARFIHPGTFSIVDLLTDTSLHPTLHPPFTRNASKWGLGGDWREWYRDSSLSIDQCRPIRVGGGRLKPEIEEESYIEDHIPLVSITYRVFTPAGTSQYTYEYQLMALEEYTVYDLKAQERKAREAREGREEELIEEYLEAYKEAESQINAIQLHNQQAAYFAKEAAHFEELLAQETDPSRMEVLGYQLLVAKANQQGELDHAYTKKTGEFRRTNTLWDDYTRARMLEKSSEMAQEFSKQQRIMAGLPRLIGLAPKEDQQFLEDFVRRNLDVTDTESMRDLVDAVGNQVLGNWQAVGAEAEYEAAIAEERIALAQVTKVAAGAVLIGAAAPLATSLGFSANSVAWAPTAMRIAYGGSTGYLEGGASTALKHSLSWSHMLGSIAVAGYDGFYAVGQDGEKGGWTGAALGAGQAYLFGRIFEFGIQKSGQFLTAISPESFSRPLFGTIPTPHTQVNFDNTRYKQELANGRALVKNWQDAQFKLVAAQSTGTPGQVDEMQRKVYNAVAQINSSNEAKWLLKTQLSPHQQILFNNELSGIHMRTEGRFYDNLERMGYDTSHLNFAPARNARNMGSVGMDYDFALDESTPLRITKNGQTVSRFQLMEDGQSAMDAAYSDVTGFSAESANIHITTLLHPEAFADATLLSSNIDYQNINPAHIQQAGDVFRYKAQASLDANEHSEILRTQRVSYDIEKELRTKVLGFIDHRIKREALRNNMTNVKKLQEIKNHWTRVHRRLEIMGREETDPAAIRKMQQELEMLTGTSIEDLMDQVSFHFETLGKFY